MDAQHFDDVVRTLSDTGSRRGALRLLVGGLLGVLAGDQVTDTEAKGKGKKGKGKAKKRKKKSKCSKKCPPEFILEEGSCECICLPRPCSGGKVFNADECRCKCPSGTRDCGDECILSDECCANDPNDEPCPEDPRGCCHRSRSEVCTIDGCCTDGRHGMKVCNGFCMDITSDPHHCGDCNVACDDGVSCIDGQCGGPAECPNGQPKCGERCCAAGEECCGGVCRFHNTAICTKDGWCPTTEGHACCATSDCSQDGPCCRFSAGEVCCPSIANDGTVVTTCCLGTHDQCAWGNCCPGETRWKDECNACCTPGVTGCSACQAAVAGRG